MKKANKWHRTPSDCTEGQTKPNHRVGFLAKIPRSRCGIKAQFAWPIDELVSTRFAGTAVEHGRAARRGFGRALRYSLDRPAADTRGAGLPGIRKPTISQNCDA
jgi:hypothetical protein